MRPMVQPLRLLLFSFLLFIAFSSLAQPLVKSCKPPKNRELWHDRIDREQKNVLKSDGKADQYFQAGSNEDINYFITEAVDNRVDDLQCRIETDSTIGDQKKVGYLRGIENLLRNFSSLYRSRQFTPSHFPSA